MAPARTVHCEGHVWIMRTGAAATIGASRNYPPSGRWHRCARRTPKPVLTAKSFAFLPAAQKAVRCAGILAGFHRTRRRGFCKATPRPDGDAEIEFSLPSSGYCRAEPNGSVNLLPNSSTSKNFASCVVVDFAAARKRHRAARVPATPQRRDETLPRAVEWERQLAAGEVRSRAEIARREGLSRVRVTQLLGRRRVPTGAGTGRP